jgi:hypothetical protein
MDRPDDVGQSPVGALLLVPAAVTFGVGNPDMTVTQPQSAGHRLSPWTRMAGPFESSEASTAGVPTAPHVQASAAALDEKSVDPWSALLSWSARC